MVKIGFYYSSPSFFLFFSFFDLNICKNFVCELKIWRLKKGNFLGFFSLILILALMFALAGRQSDFFLCVNHSKMMLYLFFFFYWTLKPFVFYSCEKTKTLFKVRNIFIVYTVFFSLCEIFRQFLNFLWNKKKCRFERLSK